MQKTFRQWAGLAIALFLTCHSLRAVAQTNNSGLWVGQVSLQNVNETVNGITTNQQVYSPDPSVVTPVAAPLNMNIILHVDANGQVRLLKGVAFVNTASNTTPDVTGTNTILISDPTLYQNYGNNSGTRITAVAFDFGDPSGEQSLYLIASNAAIAAVNGADPLAAATTVQQSIQNNVPTNATAAYGTFLQSASFQNSASVAAAAATSSLAGTDADTAAVKFQIANAAAVTALLNANIFTAADALTLNEVPLTGQLSPGSTLTGSIYVGADHPTNPFRHKWNPIHQHGYAITRELTISFDSASSSNAVGVAGFGVNRITGTYQEQIFGLHKPLGPNQNIGLITQGPMTLSRISLVNTLNQ
jgi:hypothetical protein